MFLIPIRCKINFVSIKCLAWPKDGQGDWLFCTICVTGNSQAYVAFNGPFPASLIFLFLSFQLLTCSLHIKFCRRRDSNSGPRHQKRPLCKLNHNHCPQSSLCLPKWKNAFWYNQPLWYDPTSGMIFKPVSWLHSSALKMC